MPSPAAARRASVAALLAWTLLVYLPLADSGFVSLDDYAYVVDNPAVNRGLTWEGLLWAFTSGPEPHLLGQPARRLMQSEGA